MVNQPPSGIGWRPELVIGRCSLLLYRIGCNSSEESLILSMMMMRVWWLRVVWCLQNGWINMSGQYWENITAFNDNSNTNRILVVPAINLYLALSHWATASHIWTLYLCTNSYLATSQSSDIDWDDKGKRPVLVAAGHRWRNKTQNQQNQSNKQQARLIVFPFVAFTLEYPWFGRWRRTLCLVDYCFAFFTSNFFQPNTRVHIKIDCYRVLLFQLLILICLEWMMRWLQKRGRNPARHPK